MENQNGFWTRVVRAGGWKTIEVDIGGIPLGGGHPVRLQSMTNTNTLDTVASGEQVIRIVRAGADYVRLTARNIPEAENLENIKQYVRKRGYDTPLIADVHFNPRIALIAAQIVEKVRINPGNFIPSRATSGSHIELIRDTLIPLLDICRKHGTAVRIGVNHGSLSPEIMERYGDTPEGMVESAMEYLRICRQENFHRLVVSIKSSSTRALVHANRLLVWKMLAEDMHYPLHLGLTEAGEGEDGRMKSAASIAGLLADGIGDTIRVSLTEDPEEEIPVARKIIECTVSKKRELSRAEEHDDSVFPPPFSYTRRKNRTQRDIGSDRQPAVILSLPAKRAAFEELLALKDTVPDYIFVKDYVPDYSLPQIIPLDQWLKGNYERLPVFPLLRTDELTQLKLIKARLIFIEASIDDPDIENRLSSVTAAPAVLILDTGMDQLVSSVRQYICRPGISCSPFPVILKAVYHEPDPIAYSLKASCNIGPLLLDGLADGIWIENTAIGGVVINCTVAFNLMQATRMRTYKTEFISCPSCGRTVFDIKSTAARVRQRTGHLKGLRIAVMGCLVNGPGEMADADYGYVGAAPGKVTLYRNRQVVKKNIPEDQAVDELVHLIRSDGKWTEPGNDTE